MNYRRFGRTGWNVSEIGYGMWGLAGWSGSDAKETLASLNRAIELGCNFFDTAWAYGDGKSEKILADVLRENKNRVRASGSSPWTTAIRLSTSRSTSKRV